MEGGIALDLAREAIMMIVRLGLPLLLVTLAVGILVSLIQALTQIQEMTLTFIPKMLTLFITFLLLLPYFGQQMRNFATTLFQQIEALQ